MKSSSKREREEITLRRSTRTWLEDHKVNFPLGSTPPAHTQERTLTLRRKRLWHLFETTKYPVVVNDGLEVMALVLVVVVVVEAAFET